MPDPSARRATAERAIGGLRVAVAALAVPAVVDGWNDLLPGLDVLTAAAVGALAATGLLAIALAGRDPDAVGRWSGIADIVVFGLVALAQAHHELAFVAILLVVTALVGGLRFGLRGGVVTLGWDAAALTAWFLLRTRIAGEPVAPEGLLLAVPILALMAIVGGQLTDQADRSRRRAEERRREAEAAHRRTERAVRELELLNRIFVIGLETMETHGALQSILRDVADELGYDVLSVLRRDGGSPGGLRVASSDPAVEADPPTVDPDGPVEQALRRGRSRVVGGSQALMLDLGGADTTSEAVAPIRIHDEIMGVLVAESRDPGHFDHLNLRSLERIASQLGLVVMLADMLERETEIAERYRELDRMKTDFVAIASHELRTPLTAILGFSETLDRHDDPGDELADRLVRGIRRNALRLDRLIDDLRTVGQLDAGQLEVRHEPTEVDRVVSNVLETMGAVAELHAEGPPGLAVWSDEHRLYQVLANLVRNAVDHAEGRAELLWRRDGDAVEFRVRDDGPGVPPDAVDRIFDRFTQAGGSLAHSKGTGLGLAIARELVEAMGGSLGLDTTYREGACFVVRLRAVGGADRDTDG